MHRSVKIELWVPGDRVGSDKFNCTRESAEFDRVCLSDTILISKISFSQIDYAR